MQGTLAKYAELYNYAEVIIWPALGVAAGVYGLRRTGPSRRRCLLAAAVLFLFGLSDWFEANTGNQWWRPWWLFLWKAACVITLLALLVDARRPGLLKSLRLRSRS